MKWMSDRSSRAAAPMSTVKRDPESFAARSKSRMPSATPRSQCAFGANARLGFSPQWRTTLLSSSLVPSGVLASGTLGTTTRTSRTFASISVTSFSRSLISVERRLSSSRLSANSCDFLSSLAIASLAWLRCACLRSSAPMDSRRFLSSSRIGSRVSAAAGPRRSRPFCTSSR
jgi:hypothetical protein